MPYVPQENRPEIDSLVEQLAAAITAEGDKYDYDGAYFGMLNYALTRLVMQTMPAKRYWTIAAAVGVLENVKQEFYRRLAGPYEDEAIAKNGDVPEYA